MDQERSKGFLYLAGGFVLIAAILASDFGWQISGSVVVRSVAGAVPLTEPAPAPARLGVPAGASH